MKDLENGSPAPKKPEGGHKPPKPYKIKIDGNMFEVENRYITGREILALVQKSPEDNEVALKEHGHDTRVIGLDEQVDLETPGLEKFITYSTSHIDGEGGPQGSSPFVLPEEDMMFAERHHDQIELILEGNKQWVLIHDFDVPEGYNIDKVTAAIQLPVGYPSLGPDMVYFYPGLALTSGRAIHAADVLVTILGKTYQRWSRHFTSSSPWRPGEDSLETYCLMIKGWLKKELTR